MQIPVAFTLAAVTFAAALPAQRGEPALEWQKRTTSLDYGAVPVGRHTLAELPVGEQWRLGNNNASTWTAEMPIVCGERVLAPGQYRINLQRLAEDRCAVIAQGSHFALGSGDDARIEGALGKASKPGKKLAIDWTKAASKDKHNLPAQMVVQFGEAEWKGDVLLVGNKPAKVGGWQLFAFTLPAALHDGKRPLPLAVLQKGDERWNLIVSGSEAKLLPWMAAPTDSFGFGEVAPPDAARTSEGTVTAADAPDGKPVEFLELRQSALQKGSFALEFAVGSRTLQVSVPEPKPKPK